ncbi:DUF2089 domain-containing protein [Mycoplasmatota bacterium]|nr:DUF2089 domain-containing protein [Mycoplasmatota bacterium]
MKKYVLSKCPVCEGQLSVKSLYCTNCNTEINGAFTLNKFNYLTKEQLSFVEIFVKNRGSIKDVEKDLNISYPTVRRLLDEVIVALGYKTSKTVNDVNRMEVLAQLERGEITVDSATELLNK